MASTEVRSARTRLESTRRPDFRTETGEHYETADFIDSGETGAEPRWLSEEHADPPSRWPGIRLDPGRRGMAALVAFASVVAVVGAFFAWSDSTVATPVPPLPTVEIIAAATVPETASAVVDVVVSVVGLVRTPSLVTLPPGSRIADAIAAAGGVVDGADTISLNLAQRVSDGDQIVVSPPGLPPAAVGGSTAGAAVVDDSVQAVSLNSATEAQLDDLPGVGPVTAASIVAWRTENGPFTSIEQLGEVDGIGPVRLQKLRDQVTL